MSASPAKQTLVDEVSIGPSAVFGRYGSARCADGAWKMRSISPPRKSNPI